MEGWIATVPEWAKETAYKIMLEAKKRCRIPHKSTVIMSTAEGIGNTWRLKHDEREAKGKQ
jgi:hypothetical protein